MHEALLMDRRQRAARVIEVALLTGRALSWWQREAREAGALRPWYVVLTMPRDVLHRRIAARARAMLDAGLVEEVRALLAQGISPQAPGLDAVGYREVVAMLAGRLPAAELLDAIVVGTRRYAKRQETWFRNQLRRQPSAHGAGVAAAAARRWLDRGCPRGRGHASRVARADGARRGGGRA